MQRHVTLFRMGALASFALSAMHIIMIRLGAPAYRFFDAGEDMARLAEEGSPVPAVVTFSIASGLAGFGMYALAGAGDIARLPLQTRILKLISAIYVLRGLVITGQIVLFFKRGYSIKSMLFSLVALLIGTTHLLAIREKKK